MAIRVFCLIKYCYIIDQKNIFDTLYFKYKWLQACWQLNALTVSAQILTLPLVVYHFHQFPNYFLLSNFIVVPLSSIILILGLALILFNFLFPKVAVYFSVLVNFLIELIKKNKTTTYGTVCDAFGLKPLNGVWSDHPLCLIFDEIDRLDAENNRPFKTSIVLTKNGGNVGGGCARRGAGRDSRDRVGQRAAGTAAPCRQAQAASCSARTVHDGPAPRTVDAVVARDRVGESVHLVRVAGDPDPHPGRRSGCEEAECRALTFRNRSFSCCLTSFALLLLALALGRLGLDARR